MKRAFAISLIVSIAAITIFSALAMQHASAHGHVGCLSAAAPVPACPASDVVTMFLFHAGILKSLLLAIVGSFAVLACALFIAVVITLHERAGPSFPTRRSALFSLITPLAYSRAALARWLALHENSPSYM